MPSGFMERKFESEEKEDQRKGNQRKSREAEPAEPQIVAVLRKSRKNFLVEYGCGLILLGGVGFFYLQQVPLMPFLRNLAIGAGLFALAYGEISRLFLCYVISESKISIIKGIIKQSRKNVNYHPLAFVPDISMKQSHLQRLLNYGTVFIESGSTSIEIKDVDRPKEVMELVEGLIEKTRRGG